MSRSLRNLLKVPRYGLFYFPSDKSTSILSTKKITKVIKGDNTTKGSEVMIKYEDEELVATIVGVAGKIRFYS